MFCVYCGAKLNNEFIFCWKCGKKIPEIISDDEKSAVPEPESKTVSEELPEADVNEYSFEDNEEETVFEDDEEETVFEDDEEEAAFEDDEEEAVFEDDEEEAVFEDDEEETVFEDDEEETVFEDDEEETVFEDDEEETIFEDDENITKEKINTSNGTDNISSNMSFFYERTPEGNVITSFYGDSEKVNLPESIKGEKMIGFSISLFYKLLCDYERSEEENKSRKLFIPKGITLITDIGNDWSYLMENDELSFAEFAVEEDHPAFSVENGVLYNKDKTKLLRIPSKISGTIDLPDSLLEISEEDLRRVAELTVGKKNEV